MPPLTSADKELLTEHVFAVLDAREHYPGHTLARLYDPDKMPPDLRAAHERLDLAVERLYRSQPFESDDERLEHLFDRYEAATKELARA